MKSAKESINGIYEEKLFKLLNESANGLAGERGRRAAEKRKIERQHIIARAL